MSGRGFIAHHRPHKHLNQVILLLAMQCIQKHEQGHSVATLHRWMSALACAQVIYCAMLLIAQGKQGLLKQAKQSLL